MFQSSPDLVVGRYGHAFGSLELAWLEFQSSPDLGVGRYDR